MRLPRIWHRAISFFIKGLKKVDIEVVVFDKSRIEDYLGNKLPKTLIELQDFLMDTGFSKFTLISNTKEPLCWYSDSSGRVVLNLALIVFNNQQKEEVKKVVEKAREVEALMKQNREKKQGLS